MCLVCTSLYNLSDQLNIYNLMIPNKPYEKRMSDIATNAPFLLNFLSFCDMIYYVELYLNL